MSATVTKAIERLVRSIDPKEQLQLREALRGPRYHENILRIFLNNPFFRLTSDEVEHLKGAGESLVNSLVLARDAAAKSQAPKISVFCMPKSGSSFVQSALRAALQLPFVSLTSVSNPGASSYFGMNSREQELDEFALVKTGLAYPKGYVTQNHTRCSLYLTLQLRFYGVAPILTVRNILDCLVSFDDMMLSWRQDRPQDWIKDTQFTLPLNYPELDEATRHQILARSFGIWLIGFYLSWKRCIRSKFVNPIVLRYERDILDPSEFVRKMSAMTRMTDEQVERLRAYVASPDRKLSRLNVGVSGRGAQIAPATVDFLLDYARQFGDELSAPEIAYLIR